MKVDVIYNEDCLEGMKRLSDKSIDLIFYDPPYNKNKDYGIFKDNLSETDYIIFHKKVIEECMRLTRNGITIFITQTILKLFWPLFPEARLIVIHKRAAGIRRRGIMEQWCPLLTTSSPVKQAKGRGIEDLWENIRLPGEGYYFREQRSGNPGQTSMALTEKVITAFSNSNDIVLDPFIGSGTTAIACKKLDRHYIGFEINPEYCQIAKRRLSEVQLELV